jgi:prophage regulatory protein
MDEPLLLRKLLYIYDLEQITGRNRLTLRRWWSKGLFPTPSKINAVLVWRKEVIDEWINTNV